MGMASRGRKADSFCGPSSNTLGDSVSAWYGVTAFWGACLLPLFVVNTMTKQNKKKTI